MVTLNLCKTNMTVKNRVLGINFNALQQLPFYAHFLSKCYFEIHQF